MINRNLSFKCWNTSRMIMSELLPNSFDCDGEQSVYFTALSKSFKSFFEIFICDRAKKSRAFHFRFLNGKFKNRETVSTILIIHGFISFEIDSSVSHLLLLRPEDLNILSAAVERML